jgi:hypothetical protein
MAFFEFIFKTRKGFAPRLKTEMGGNFIIVFPAAFPQTYITFKIPVFLGGPVVRQHVDLAYFITVKHVNNFAQGIHVE